MHWLDSALLALLAMGAGFGFMTGLLWQIARIASLGLAFAGTLLFHEPAVQIVQEYLLRDADTSLISGAAYTLVFLLVYFLLVLVTRFAQKMIQASGFAWMDRCLGALLGTVKTAAILGGVCLLISRSTHPATRVWMERCSVAPFLSRTMEVALTLIPEDYKRSLAESLVNLRAKAEEQ